MSPNWGKSSDETNMYTKRVFLHFKPFYLTGGLCVNYNTGMLFLRIVLFDLENF